MEQTETLAAKAVAGEDLMHPLVRGAVFREQDHPAIVPLTIWLEVGREPAEDGLGLGVSLIPGSLRPCPQVVQRRPLLWRQRY